MLERTKCPSATRSSAPPLDRPATDPQPKEIGQLGPRDADDVQAAAGQCAVSRLRYTVQEPLAIHRHDVRTMVYSCSDGERCFT